MIHRRSPMVIVVTVLAIAVLVVAGLLFVDRSRSAPSAAVASHPPRHTTPHPTGPKGSHTKKNVTPPTSPQSGVVFHHQPPPYTAAANTVTQVRIDGELAAQANPAYSAAFDTVTCPGPSLSSGWTMVPQSATENQYAVNYIVKALSITFARQSRSGLDGWLVANSSVWRYPGISITSGHNALCSVAAWPQSITIPALQDGKPPVVHGSAFPTPAEWTADAANHVRWAVTNVSATPVAQFESSEWIPPAEEMAYTVTATVVVTEPGHAPVTKSVGAEVMVGPGTWVPGYGVSLITSTPKAP